MRKSKLNDSSSLKEIISADIIKSARYIKKSKRKPYLKLSPIMHELIKARISSGLSKSELADKMRKHLGQVIVMESGKTKMPSIPLLQAYAKALGGDIEIFFVKRKKDKK